MSRASPTTLATTMVVMRAFVGIMAGPPLPGHSLTCIAHPAWPFLARPSRRVGKAKRAHHCLRVGNATPLPTLQTRSESRRLRNADFSARCGGAYIDIASRRHDFEGFGIDRRPGRRRSGIVHRRRHEGDAGLDIDAGAERPDIAIDIRQRGHARYETAGGADE